ncbi:MAG TPA: sigma-70 family RNA polymerase sigma factor [Terriglobales bacterium]|nr:sigma-70 family RNA polymerase sigma factor [Terriglobales bacterium]
MNADSIGTGLLPVVTTEEIVPEADAYVEGDRQLDVPDECAIRQLQAVLSSGLPSFYRSAYRLLGNAADAEDAVQDALCAAYKHLGQFRGQSHMSTWLTSIVRNCALMQLRRRPRQIDMSLDERIGEEQEHSLSEKVADGRPSPEDQCRNSELNAHVRKFAAQLSPALRRTFQLREMDDLSICETARILGIPSGTVKAQLARARKKLKESLRQALKPRSQKPLPVT